MLFYMKHNRIFSILLGLSLVGLVLSISLSLFYYDIRSGQASFNPICKINETFDCAAVDGSKYAELISGFPLASFTAGWFLAIAILSLMGFSAGWAPTALRMITGMFSIGTVMSVVYFYIMAMVLKKFCPQCLGIDAVNLAGLAIAYSGIGSLKTGSVPSRDHWFRAMVTVGAVVGITVLFLKTFDQSKLEGVSNQELADSVRAEPAATLNISSALPVLGDPSAKVTIVEFSDFQCPYCRQGAKLMHSLLQRYPKGIKVVYAGFPLDQTCNTTMKSRGHPHACEAARAALCANEQGKFGKMYETIFDRQDEITDGIVMTWAKEIGLDVAALEKCMKDPKTAALISSSVDQALTLGVKSTPTFFLNGKKMEGALPFPVWTSLLDEMTAK
ncbi:MAG: thioredoxin domain-containing protein [Bdellovibrionales bacterium]|nr:thioredoxin domain-containing protein [Bdellovibrionales bacterium]